MYSPQRDPGGSWLLFFHVGVGRDSGHNAGHAGLLGEISLAFPENRQSEKRGSGGGQSLLGYGRHHTARAERLPSLHHCMLGDGGSRNTSYLDTTPRIPMALAAVVEEGHAVPALSSLRCLPLGSQARFKSWNGAGAWSLRAHALPSTLVLPAGAFRLMEPGPSFGEGALWGRT